jgi:hypothetical protein
MTQPYPQHVARFLKGFQGYAEKLRNENKDDRNEDTVARMLDLIRAPWSYNRDRAVETKQVTFLRDYFNVFREVLQACESLETIRWLISETLDDPPKDRIVSIVTHWSESYLNEVYIFQVRLLDFLTYTERRYKKDEDFAEPIVRICSEIREFVLKTLKPVIGVRSTHVHNVRKRHIDPELARLDTLNVFIDVLGAAELEPRRVRAIAAATEWLLRETKGVTEICWTLFDGACEVLAEGIVTDNDWLVVPMNYKDDRSPFQVPHRPA